MTFRIDQKLNKCPEIPPLTGLRFFAALFVCVAHTVSHVAPGLFPGLSQLAAEGMTLFFVLSGFVIHYNYSFAIKENPTIGIYNFFVSRFARLYPLFFICLCFDLIHHYGYSTLSTHLDQALPYYLTMTQSWFYVPMGTHGLIYEFGLMPSVAWSVSTEWFFYVCYPLICFALFKATKMKMKISIFCAICIIWTCLIAITYFFKTTINAHAISTFGSIADISQPLDSFLRWLIYFSPYARIGEFLIGCSTAAIYLQIANKKPSRLEEVAGFCIIISALISMMFLHYFIFNASQFNVLTNKPLFLFFAFAPFNAVIIFCCARYKNVVSRFLSFPLILLGGEISYSIYLLHLPIMEAFSRDAAVVTSWKVAIADISRLIIAMSAIFGTALISYRMIEVPGKRILRKWLSLQKEIPQISSEAAS